MNKSFSLYTASIRKYIQNYLISQIADLREINQWGNDVITRLEKFASTGKLIRGCLVLFSHAAYRGRRKNEAMKVAGAIELIHAGLLIHDDIMDRDPLRRGSPSIYQQYQNLAETGYFKNPSHYGISQGINAGDLCFFLAFALLGNLKSFSRELTRVVIAQMQDISTSSTLTYPSYQEIINLYRYKTARYTFSLPLSLGALLAGQKEPELKQLENLGETMGLIFQMKDDELGIFGNAKQTGKPVGSDIRENKKTLYYYYLMQKTDKVEKHKLLSIFGKAELTLKDLDAVRGAIKRLKIDRLIDGEIKRLAKQAKLQISKLTVGAQAKEELLSLLAFAQTRNK